MSFRNALKKNRLILYLYNNFTLFFRQVSINAFRSTYQYFSVYADYIRFRNRESNHRFKTSLFYVQPYFTDKTKTTPVDPVYFYQDTWCASMIFQNKPTQHVDVGSSAKTVGIISQFTPTTMVDIRPLELSLNGLNFIEGSILDLPFEDNSVESLSSICVVEHIGLGRYGDPIDTFGSEKAIKELKRVVKPGGFLYFSVPVDDECKCLFNNCRTFTPDTIINLFEEFELIDQKYQYGNRLLEQYNRELGFGTGLFAFKKK